ncbi:hypothetical protein [Pseudoalteromonas peptidolytica]|uniref:hypothetical protein n=1 Tax=Pseudoalteromonas peptidolytica TaxID=61150 RepID=UPI001174844B|nr:hypothetical protein [Pseudoalteromonas peptidolytica]NLR15570.1 hypothetical protein [Pseudoalteromonas peptidolytica]GEK08314.1 hypothetical protein PPE03_05630 [Pseudoalteromonas peptidolytica]
MTRLILEKDLKKMSVGHFFKKGIVYKENEVFKFCVLDSQSEKYSILKFGTVESRSFKNVASVYSKLLDLNVYEFVFFDQDRRRGLINGKA